MDNGSSDRTFELAERFGPPVRAISAAPPGAGAARNAGARAAAADCPRVHRRRLLPGAELALARASRRSRTRSSSRAPCSPIRAPLSGPSTARSGWAGRSGLYETANLLVRRELFDRIGGFEDWIDADGRPMGEDLWFGWRARRAGARTAFCDRALVHHAVFPRGPRDYVAERARLVHFPTIAARIPELRERFFWRRWFLNQRSAAFDAAVLAVGVAARTRSPLPLAAAIPYARIAARRARPWRRRAPLVAAADVAADAVGLAALAAGSIRRRSPLL